MQALAVDTNIRYVEHVEHVRRWCIGMTLARVAIQTLSVLRGVSRGISLNAYSVFKFIFLMSGDSSLLEF
jgi:hypothetical protein